MSEKQGALLWHRAREEAGKKGQTFVQHLKLASPASRLICSKPFGLDISIPILQTEEIGSERSCDFLKVTVNQTL